MLNPEQAKDIRWALGAFQSFYNDHLTRADFFRLVNDYYRGNHRLLFATEKFKTTFGALFEAFSENLCPMVVDTVADMLQIESFTAADNADITDVAREIWRRNRMAERAGQQHKATLLYGESFAIVWPDRQGKPIIFPNLPSSVVCKFDDEQVGFITQAAKAWLTQPQNTQDWVGTTGSLQGQWQIHRKVRLNLYFPDRIEKYITKDEMLVLPTNPEVFEPFQPPGEPWPLPNPYGKVPVFRFANNAGPGEPGVSELSNVIPLQDALNKSLCDMLVAMEFEAFAQRWATGLEVQRDDKGRPIPPFKAGVDRVWAVEGEATKFGDFTRADLEQFIHVQNGFRLGISRVSGIPAHYFMFDKGGWPSGESLKTATERLTTKVGDRQVGYGNTWDDVMRFCLEIGGKPGVNVETAWTDTSPRASDLESWTVAGLQQTAGVSVEQTLQERGYTKDQIDEMNLSTFLKQHGDGFPAAPKKPQTGATTLPKLPAATGVTSGG